MEIDDEYYDSIALGYDELYGEEQIDKLNFFLKLLSRVNFSKNKIKIIDFGCGSCVTVPHFIDFLIEKNIVSVKYIGVDSSKELIKLAQKRLENIKFEINFDYELIVSNAVDYIKKIDISKSDIIISLTAIQNFKPDDFINLFLSKIDLEKQVILLSVLNRSESIDYIRNSFIEMLETEPGSKDDYFYNYITGWSR